MELLKNIANSTGGKFISTEDNPNKLRIDASKKENPYWLRNQETLG